MRVENASGAARRIHARDLPMRLVCGFAGLLLLRLLFSVGGVEHVPTFVPFILLALTGLTLWKQPAGLIVLAAIVPIASWAGRGWEFYVAWAEALVIAVAAGWFMRAAVTPRATDDLDRPIQFFSAVVVASFLVYAAVFNWRLTGTPFSLAATETFRNYFVIRRAGDALDATMRLLESMFLLRAASAAVRASPGFTIWMARSTVLGAAAAGALNLWRVWEGARRTDAPLAAFVRYVATIRQNIHYADLNAAGSYFVLVLFVAMGVALLPRGRKWIPAAVVIAMALWLTGSRAAIVAGLLALLLPAAYASRSLSLSRSRVRIGLVAATLLLVGGAIAAAQYLPKRGNQHSSLDAIVVRWELIKTGARMTVGHPAFGVGVGQFYQLSGDFSSEDLLRLFPSARNENAHNNFLQILAELGLVGFAGFAWILAVAGARVRSTLEATDLRPLRWAIACGLTAFLLTCLAGHPLLIDEPAFTFWLIGGTAAGTAAAGGAVSRSSRIRRSGFAVAVLLLVLLIPVRVARGIAQANMEHAGFGLSAWQTAADGVRYRSSTGRSSVFLPAHARALSIPLRSVGEPRRLQLLLDGRPADVVVVPADRWFELRLSLPADAAAPTRFRRLDLEVMDLRSRDASVLMIGKVDSR